MAKQKRFLILCGLVLLCLAVILKPALVRTDGHLRLLVLLRWQSGAISFVNSVTGQPVRIGFTIGRLFQDFSMTTDETTEAYYTQGVYAMNTVVSKEATDVLRFCSQKGIELTLGFYEFLLKDECMEVELLWKH
jgi:hypothetical protein